MWKRRGIFARLMQWSIDLLAAAPSHRIVGARCLVEPPCLASGGGYSTSARMAELADALDLGSSSARSAGSTPVPGTIIFSMGFGVLVIAWFASLPVADSLARLRRAAFARSLYSFLNSYFHAGHFFLSSAAQLGFADSPYESGTFRAEVHQGSRMAAR